MSGLSRRAFVRNSAGLTFALALPAGLFVSSRAARAMDSEGKPVGAWVTIAPDGAIDIAMPVAEMGQGSMTGVAMILAEELDADWSRVTTHHAPVEPAIFANPLFRSMSTFGSGSVRGYWDVVRLQGAAVRQVLLQAAAGHWNVAASECRTETGKVIHDPTRRTLTYGEIAGFAQVPDQLPKVDKSALKTMADFRIVGTKVARLDIPAKTDGSAEYSIDQQLPGMVYATVLRGPVFGTAPVTVDGSAALAVPGVTHVLKLEKAVGIVGQTMEAVIAARGKVKATWTATAADNYDSDIALAQFMNRAADLSDPGNTAFKSGDIGQAIGGAAKVLKAHYSTDHVYHAQMEPLNVTVSVDADGKGADIWIATQSAEMPKYMAADILGTSRDKVRVHQRYLGGGFGRRTPPDQLPEAVVLAKQLGRPVKLIWTREEDIAACEMRPLTGHYLEAALDAAGALTGWRHRIAAESPVAMRNGEAALKGAGGADFLVMAEAQYAYRVPNQEFTYLREQRGMQVAPWRSIGAGHNVFAREAFFDEVAHAQGQDPVAARLALLDGAPRAQAVLKAVAERAQWGRTMPEGRALGVASAMVVESYLAAVADVELDRKTGAVRVHKVWVAIDPGIAINPDSVLAQTEGNVVWGVSAALKESLTIKGGKIQQTNYGGYQVLRMAETPEIDVQLMVTDNPPKGMGEAALPLVAPCIANALFALTGVRFRQLPMTPERVLAGLASA